MQEDGWKELLFILQYRRDHIDTVKLLLEKGADKNSKDAYGATPLDKAKSDEMKDLLKG